MALPPGASEPKAQTRRHGLWRTVLFGGVERELYVDAERCFRNPQMSYAHLTFGIAPETEEQMQRLERYGYTKGQNFFYRDIKSVLIDYAVAKQQGLDWDKDLRNFGLPM